jgi:hypothetical protein
MKMKRMAGFAALLMGSAMTMAAAAQTSTAVKDDLFNGTEVFAKGASDVTEITMDPDTLDLVGGKDGRKAHNMILNVVRTYEYDKPGMYRIEDVDAFRNKLNSGDWHCSIHTRDLKSGESTDVCNRHRTDDLSETAIITVEPKELTFIHTIRKKGDGESDVSGIPFPMMLGMGGLTNLAMLDPDAFADLTTAKMQLSLGRDGMLLDGKSFDFQRNMDMKDWPKVDGKQMQMQIDRAMKDMPKLDNQQMKLKMDEAMKELEKAQKNLKLDSVTPDGDDVAPKTDEPAPQAPPPPPAPQE